ncbi:tyrosine-type recombinase/integrase [Xanthobacter sp. TB0136]|uniref:tyrosine-type recombinase/integrase n=1 Tax=Xanthobacter sp. TB0136 TaxID=3459177 RepID=UPI00403902B4
MAQRTRKCARSGRDFVRGQRYPITYAGFGTRFSRTVAKAGLNDLRIHDLRHTGATRTLRASKNLKAVQEMLGHTDIKTTMRYAHAMKDDVAEAMRARQADEAVRRAEHDRRTKSRKSPEQEPQQARSAMKDKG